MYIEEIILDGFKSYMNRTAVSGFDPYFNAITGLNGSGKSNILDAICFVLGITNLSQVGTSISQLIERFVLDLFKNWSIRMDKPELPKRVCPSSSTTKTNLRAQLDMSKGTKLLSLDRSERTRFSLIIRS
jgi:AAA15 family ATPase/GTPase